MKIILIFNTFYKSSFFYELGSLLEDRGHNVVVYDLVSSRYYNFRDGETKHFNPFLGAKYLLKIKGLRRLFIPFINKKFIAKNVNSSDIVHFHYLEKRYSYYSKFISRKTTKIITTFWGSDLLRADKKLLDTYSSLLRASNLITMVPGIQDKFGVTYPEFTSKVRTTMFGLSILDIIKKITEDDIVKFKQKYKINLERKKFCITLGYNSSPAQQHKKLINILKSLDVSLKSEIYLLLPLTYGGTDSYKKELLELLESIDISYKVFLNFLDIKELAILRSLSTLTLNIQISDAFSASISESLAGENIVLVGDWLPYDIYKSWGVEIFKSSLDNYGKSLESILRNYDDFYKIRKENSQIIHNKLSWDKTINYWEEVLNEVKFCNE